MLLLIHPGYEQHDGNQHVPEVLASHVIGFRGHEDEKHKDSCPKHFASQIHPQ